MSNLNATICRILGLTDALFSPVRFSAGSKSWVNVTLMRKDYFRSGGIRWRSGVTDEADRKAASRSLSQAVDAGLIVKLEQRQAKFPIVQLTPAGEETARYLSAPSTPEDDFAFVRRLERLCEKSPNAFVDERSDGNRFWILETDLIGPGHKPGDEDEFLKQLWLASVRLASATRRGWVESNSTVPGNLFYRTTDLWRRQKPAKFKAVAPKAVEFNQGLNRIYLNAYDEMQDVIESSQPSDPREIGHPPLCAGMDQRRDAKKTIQPKPKRRKQRAKS